MCAHGAFVASPKLVALVTAVLCNHKFPFEAGLKDDERKPV